ncbi:unnamed protein product, partial [Mesorhabditis spiculigera]
MTTIPVDEHRYKRLAGHNNIRSFTKLTLAMAKETTKLVMNAEKRGPSAFCKVLKDFWIFKDRRAGVLGEFSTLQRRTVHQTPADSKFYFTAPRPADARTSPPIDRRHATNYSVCSEAESTPDALFTTIWLIQSGLYGTWIVELPSLSAS